MRAIKISELMSKYERFIEDTGGEEIIDFARWLSKDTSGDDLAKDGKQLNRDIAYQINRLSRFSKYYVKNALKDFEISSLEEYLTLVFIRKRGNPSKMEVYNDIIIETTTGTQIVKRLIQIGLIIEEIDTEDKRVKRLRLTPSGTDTLDKCFDILGDVSNYYMTGTTTHEKEQLLRILQKLDSIHTPQFSPNEPMQAK